MSLIFSQQQQLYFIILCGFVYKKNLTEILLSGQQRVLRGTIHPSTGDPRINIVGRARTPVLEVDCNKEVKSIPIQ